MMNKKLSAFMNKHFRQWEDLQGSKQPVTAFARWLNMNQVTVNRYMNGDSEPEGDNLRQLARKLGPEIYEVLGREVPADLESPDLSELPESLRERLESAIVETRDAYHARKISLDDPEAEKIAISIFERFGFKYNSTKKSD